MVGNGRGERAGVQTASRGQAGGRALPVAGAWRHRPLPRVPLDFVRDKAGQRRAPQRRARKEAPSAWFPLPVPRCAARVRCPAQPAAAGGAAPEAVTEATAQGWRSSAETVRKVDGRAGSAVI